MPSLSLDDCPIGHIHLEKTYGAYSFSVKMGEYYEFDYTKISNEVHRHDCYELVFILEGNGEFQYEGQTHSLHQGGLFLSEPYKTHEIHIRPRDSLILIYGMIRIRQEGPPGHSAGYEETILQHFLRSHRNEADRQLRLLSYIGFFEEYRRRQGRREDKWFLRTLENFLFHCLEILAEEVPEGDLSGNLPGDLLERALDFIDENRPLKITAEDIARAVHTSKRNLYRLFREKLNRSVHDYVKECKISLAKNYLRMNLSISETAVLVGIEDLPSFSRIFRRYAGMSPREYRKKYRRQPGGYGRRMT